MSPEVPKILHPNRDKQLPVVFVDCMKGYSCVDPQNGRNLKKNQISTEAYIKQLETLLNTVSEPSNDKR